MTSIDPAKAVDVVALLESAIRGADSDFIPPPRAPGIKVALGGLTISRGHAAAATAIGQNADALLMLACRQIGELAMTLANIKATMPPNDSNTAGIQSLIESL